MYNLEMIGLLLLFAVVILGGASYLAFNRRGVVREKLPVQPDTGYNFETAGELFPEILFPPETEREHIPDLPREYGDNRITIMARDPEWIYAYWEISEKKINDLRQTFGPDWDSSLPVLRVYDVTAINFDGHNAHSCHDVIINNDFGGSWYLHVGVPSRTYCVDLGRILSNGTFLTMARSNYTVTPRNTVSDKTDPEWMLVSDQEKRLYDRIGYGEGTSSGEFFRPH